jgi:hypothetical protein
MRNSAISKIVIEHNDRAISEALDHHGILAYQNDRARTVGTSVAYGALDHAQDLIEHDDRGVSLIFDHTSAPLGGARNDRGGRGGKSTPSLGPKGGPVNNRGGNTTPGAAPVAGPAIGCIIPVAHFLPKSPSPAGFSHLACLRMPPAVSAFRRAAPLAICAPPPQRARGPIHRTRHVRMSVHCARRAQIRRPVQLHRIWDQFPIMHDHPNPKE